MKQKLLKSLLAVALLLAGGNVWAQYTSTLYSQDFESFAADAAFSTVPGYWERASAAVEKIVENAGNKNLTYQSGGGSTRNAAINFNISDKYTAGDNWTVSFDAALTPGNKDGGMFLGIVGENGTATAGNAWSPSTGNLFSLTAASSSSTSCTVSLGAYTLDDPLTLTSGSYYHYVLNWDGSNINLTITKNGEVTPALSTSKVYSSSDNTTYGNPKAIFWVTPRYYGTTNIDNILVTEEVTSEVVSAPAIGAPVYAGDNRTITITSGTSTASNAVTTYYTIDGTTPSASNNEGSFTTASKDVTITSNCTVKAISISSTDVESSVASLDVTVGILTLNAPYFVKDSYADGSYTVTIVSDQSSLAYAPASVVVKYSINGGDEVEFSSAILLSDGETVTAHVESAGYTNSSNANMTAYARPVFGEVWTIDFAGQATVDKGGVTVSATAFSAGGVDFGTITSDSYTSNDKFGVKTGTSWLLRSTGNKGLYSFNGSATPIGIANLTEGQYVVINCNGQAYMYNSTSGVGEYKSDFSTSSQIVLRANADGNMVVNLQRYIYIQWIAVYDELEPATMSVKADKWGTFIAPFAVDLPSGVEAYTVTGISGTSLVKVPVETTIPANTPVVLNNTTGADVSETFYGAQRTADSYTVGNLTGVYTAATIPASDGDHVRYVLQTPTSGVNEGVQAFYKVASDFTATPNRCYLSVPSEAAVKAAFFELGDADAISDVRSKMEDGRSEIFNLAGQRLNKAQKGVNIVNGKKVLVK